MTDDSPSDETVEEWLNKPLSDIQPDTVSTTEVSRAVPIEELEQLADEWEERQEVTTGHGSRASAAYYHCIKELRELLEDYK